MRGSVHTGITDQAGEPARGWIFFDSGCAFCRRCVRVMKPVLAPRGFTFAPLAPGSSLCWGIRREQPLEEMRVLLGDGGVYGGADAMVALARYVWWAWPLVGAAHLPGVRGMLRWAYRSFALRRYCLTGTCARDGRANREMGRGRGGPSEGATPRGPKP